MNLLRTSLVVLLAVVFVHTAFGQEQSQPSQQDQVLAKVQGICPVMGGKLGAMGTPVKVAIGEQKETIFLCCKGCMNGKIDAKNWATIHSNFRKAQGNCPVMNSPLPANPKWTVVNGRIIYVCCPSCIAKIKADPQKYIGIVDQFYAASLNK